MSNGTGIVALIIMLLALAVVAIWLVYRFSQGQAHSRARSTATRSGRRGGDDSIKQGDEVEFQDEDDTTRRGIVHSVRIPEGNRTLHVMIRPTTPRKGGGIGGGTYARPLSKVKKVQKERRDRL